MREGVLAITVAAVDYYYVVAVVVAVRFVTQLCRCGETVSATILR
jgi:hypothetical protein